MGTFLLPADRTALIAAGRAVGLPDERTEAIFVAMPGVVWDAGAAPAVAADAKAALRIAGNLTGINDERMDALVAKVAGGIKGVIAIPTVVGQQEVVAEGNLRNAGCRVGTKTRVVNASPAGQVTAQSPTTGASEVGKPVNLTISLGP